MRPDRVSNPGLLNDESGALLMVWTDIVSEFLLNVCQPDEYFMVL